MTLETVKNALLSVLPDVYHHTGPENKRYQYIVWGEDGGGNVVHAYNVMVCQDIEGTVDYFTKAENDPNFERVQDALTAAGIPFYLNSIQWEEETGFIHYEWVFNIG